MMIPIETTGGAEFLNGALRLATFYDNVDLRVEGVGDLGKAWISPFLTPNGE
ncbi:MAG: hypothetical protein IPH85_12410 [Ignavibacteria bacterium]|nr:hypothetical protein [Ignavibacteria bacterium]